jgi:hypothetical protein
MPIDPTAFRPVGSIVFGSAQDKKFPQSFNAQLVKISPVLGPAPPGKKDNRKNWYRAGIVTQIDRSGAAIRRKQIDLKQPLLFRPDLDLSPYWLTFWRPAWVSPLTLKIERYLLPLGRPQDIDDGAHTANLTLSIDLDDP